MDGPVVSYLCLILFIWANRMLGQVPPTCDKAGICTNEKVHDTPARSLSECRQACFRVPTCYWYSFHATAKFCKLTEFCEDLDFNCGSEECLHGAKECFSEIPRRCQEPGSCIGKSLYSIDNQSLSECQRECNYNVLCTWYTYVFPEENCILFEECREVDSNCYGGTKCIHGESECYVPNPGDDEKLLVIAGELPGMGDWNNTGTTELVDLGVANEDCQALPQHPLRISSGGTAVYMNGEVAVCGGGHARKAGLHKECYVYSAMNDDWMASHPIKESRLGCAGTVFKGKWLISGGFTAANSPSYYSEYKHLHQWSSWAYNLPQYKAYHTMIPLNNTHYILTGGANQRHADSYLTDTYYYHELLPTPPKRNAHYSAGVVTFPEDGSKHLVLVGGDRLNFSFIMNLQTKKWSPLPQPPHHLGFGTSVQYRNTFIVIYGHNITMFDENKRDWVLLPKKFKKQRINPMAIFVHGNLVQRCSLPE